MSKVIGLVPGKKKSKKPDEAIKALKTENEQLKSDNEKLLAENKQLKSDNEKLLAENEQLKAALKDGDKK